MTSNGLLPVLSVLDRCFPVVRSLRQYLEDVLEDSLEHEVDFVPNHEDLPSYHELVNLTYVAMHSNPSKRLMYNLSKENMSEVIDEAQRKLISKKPVRSNIFIDGYREAFHEGIVNEHINTIVTALQATQWQTLLKRIGTSAMIHLLTETSIFVPLPNDCLCQMTGTPLNFQKTISTVPSVPQNNKKRIADETGDERPQKRPKRDTKPLKSPADVDFTLRRYLYARPKFIPGTRCVLVGLPPRHILNKYHPSYKSNAGDYDSHLGGQQARHLSKYIFPRQYGLRSVFDFSYSPKCPDFSDREKEIQKAGACKTPKRLKEVISLVEKLLWRHARCKYKLIYDKTCPSKLAGNDTLADSSVVLQLMSENGSQPVLQTQVPFGDISLDSAGNSILVHPSQIKSKPRFAEFCCPLNEVYRYVVLITNAVIPKRFWGSEANFKLICKQIKAFIMCRKHESPSLHNFLQGFSTSACEWLMPPGEGTGQYRVTVSDQLKRRDLLEDFIYWFFDSFVGPLLRTSFYITDSAAFNYQILYFRMDDWQTLCAPLLDRLTTETFQKIPETEAMELLRQRKLGFSFVRLLPKETGVRPIVNLKRKQEDGGSSINEILRATLEILNYEKVNQSQLLGASVFGPSDVYAKLKNLKANLRRSYGGALPKLYFVKVDVRACFDTIEQTKLLDILSQLLSEDAYLIKKHIQVNQRHDKSYRTTTTKNQAYPAGEHPHFLKYAADLASCIRDTIFIDAATCATTTKEEILELLEQHITDNVVKIGSEYFRQIVGIPQGSVLSTILCCFFYGDLEKRFKPFTKVHNLLLRHTDDYLFITPEYAEAKDFLDAMDKGHPEYGCFVSKEKTVVNFICDQVDNIAEHAMPWCGYLIDTQSLSVSSDYTRYQTHLSDRINVGRGRHFGSVFRAKMLKQAKTKAHIIYTDERLNSKKVVYFNIYQNFLLCAMKMHTYIRSWGPHTSANHSFIQAMIKQVIRYCFVAVSKTGSSKLAKLHGGRVIVQEQDIIWLGTHAFHTIFSRTPQCHSFSIKCLVSELALPKHWRRARKFRELVKDGKDSLAHVVY